MRSIATVLGIGVGLLAFSAFAGSAHENYMLECQGCHRADGSGLRGAVPALQGFVARFLTVPGGREYLVRVPGSAQSSLDDAALAEVLNWIVQRFGPAPIAEHLAPYTTEEIKRIRHPPLADVFAVRKTLVQRIEHNAIKPR